MKKLTRERVVPTISGQGFLADLGNHVFGNTVLTEAGQQEQDVEPVSFRWN